MNEAMLVFGIPFLGLVGIFAACWIVPAVSAFCEGAVDIARDHLFYKHTERMTRMKLNHKANAAKAQRAIVISGNTVYLVHGDRRTQLNPGDAKQCLERALMLQQSPRFQEDAEAWIVRNAHVKQLPSANRAVGLYE